MASTAPTNGNPPPGEDIAPPAGTGRSRKGIPERVNDLSLALIRFTRRRDPRLRNAFDKVLRKPLVAFAQCIINLLRKKTDTAVATEQIFPGEEEATDEIVRTMGAFLAATYTNSVAERAGNTKTYGIVKAVFTVREDLPDDLVAGVFHRGKQYPAWIRFAGPGPLVTHDLDDNGILSIGIKLLRVPGPKLLADEKETQDFTGISSPTFTTPNVFENVKLQREIIRERPAWYFLNPRDSHYMDALMQGVYAKTHANPLDLEYYSCVPYLYGEGRAMKYAVRPMHQPLSRVPRDPSYDYLREAMATLLAERDVFFSFEIQLQTDPRRMPIENSSVIWPTRRSPYHTVASIRIPRQEFDSPEQLAFARRLSYNPWHSVPEHRPLGNQNRARRKIYYEMARARQAMNAEPLVEPTGDEVF